MYAEIACCIRFFFFNDTATTEIYTLSLHDALPIFAGVELGGLGGEDLADLGGHRQPQVGVDVDLAHAVLLDGHGNLVFRHALRSEEHTSELQSRQYLVCRLLLEKKKTYHRIYCIA